MPDIEFFRTSDDCLLPLDAEGSRYVWRQYTNDGWYVRVSDQSVESVFIRVDEEVIPLERYYSDNCFTLSKTVGQRIADLIERRTGQEQNLGGWVALLDIWGNTNREPKRLHPPLYIEPGNLSDKDFEAIIARLQELAFFRYSPTRVAVQQFGGSTGGGTEENEDERLKQAAEKFLTLIKRVQSDWPLVQGAASRETQLLPKLVDVSSATGSSSSRLAAKAAQHPHARRVEILMPQESLATVENRFIVHALREIRQGEFVFKGRLESRAGELRKEWELEGDKEAKRRQSTDQWKQKQAEHWAMADQLMRLAADIADAAEKVAFYVNDPFLREVRDRPAFPNRPTDRLARSFAYGPIYRAYCDYQSQPGISFTPLRPGLMQAFNTKAIHPACTLYELWVFVELYDMLIRTFGFRPPADAVLDHPLDYVDATAGEIISDALKGHRFRLELRPLNNQQRVITVSLWYDTEERERRSGASRLRPDIYLEVTDSKADNLAEPLTFAVDAKYRKYPGYYYQAERHRHGVDTVFDLDLLITAKEKYHERLGCDAAFVVHSDPHGSYEDWGGGPDKQNHWPGPEHHYGAVPANPSNTNSLRKLLKCFLMYHMGIENICWSCRSEVKERKDLSKPNPIPTLQYDEAGRVTGIHSVDIGRKPIGHDYICGDCQRSWIRTWCSNAQFSLEDRMLEHKILKIGADNFHASNQKGTICPSCGDGA